MSVLGAALAGSAARQPKRVGLPSNSKAASNKCDLQSHTIYFDVFGRGTAGFSNTHVFLKTVE